MSQIYCFSVAATLVSLSLLACGSKDSSVSSKLDSAFGACTENALGEIQIDSAKGSHYYCDGSEWRPEKNTDPELAYIVNGSYSCSDTNGNTASFNFRDSNLSRSYKIGYSFATNSAHQYTVLDSNQLLGVFRKGRDYDYAIAYLEDLLFFTDIHSSSFVYKYLTDGFESFLSFSCERESTENNTVDWVLPFNGNIQYGTLTDSRDDHSYKTISINNITWMAQNLNFETEGSYCFEHSAANCSRYGRLYSWDIAMQGEESSHVKPSEVKGICPTGWHIPSSAEWDDLFQFLGGNQSASTILRSQFLWNETQEPGKDNFGFSAIPTGKMNGDFEFGDIGKNAYWWTTSKTDSNSIQYVQLSSSWAHMFESAPSERAHLSIRCAKDYSSLAPFPSNIEFKSITDSRDNQVYKTARIGARNWMAENLKFNATGSKCYFNDSRSCERNGRLYTWPTVMANTPSSNLTPSGVQGICPIGWHLPSTNEWAELFEYIQTGSVGSVANALRASAEWDLKDGMKGIDQFGFRALPSGVGIDQTYLGAGELTAWWTSSKAEDSLAEVISISSESDQISLQPYKFDYLVSVRCLQDYVPEEELLFGKCSLEKQDSVVFHNDTSFICESLEWQLATSAEVLNFQTAMRIGKCTIALDNVTNKIDSTYYTCSNSSWRKASSNEILSFQISQDIGTCNSASQNSVKQSKGILYICSSSFWRVASNSEIQSYLLVPTLGPCTTAMEDSSKYQPTAENVYTCSSLRWVEATPGIKERIITETNFGKCTSNLETQLDTLTSTGKVYICHNLKWQLATDADFDGLERGICTASREGEVFAGRTGSPTCKNGRWFWGTMGSFLDTRDGKLYATTKIGEQTWFAENLSYDPSTDPTITFSTYRQSICYDSTESNCTTYGRLYQWPAALQSYNGSDSIPSGIRGICPIGWHIPSFGEWNILFKYANAHNYLTGLTTSLRSPSHWNHSSETPGVDSYGFMALGGGKSILGNFSELDSMAYWWSSNETDSSTKWPAVCIGVSSYCVGLQYNTPYMSVRCLKD